jgi:hypothetical protein
VERKATQSEYENERDLRIARNHLYMQSIGLVGGHYLSLKPEEKEQKVRKSSKQQNQGLESDSESSSQSSNEEDDQICDDLEEATALQNAEKIHEKQDKKRKDYSWKQERIVSLF